MNKNKIIDIASKEFKSPKLDDVEERLRHSPSITERLIFWLAFTFLCVSSLALLSQASKNFLVEIPAHGGSFEEGIVGTPRFINPILAISDADKDLTALVFSGLMKVSDTGELVPDLAKEYSVSTDGLTYTFILKDDLTFHDGVKLTTDDVEFTILKAQDPTLKSPRRGNWDGVIVKKIDEKQISFTLKQPYSPFLENTTMGILPKHIWKNADSDEFAFSQINTEPIGSGPYKLGELKRNSGGLPIQYSFKSFKDYTGGEPFISNIYVRFFQSEDDLLEAEQRGVVESAGGISAQKISPLKENSNLEILHSPLPRIFGLFFNQNQASVFLHPEVRRALNISVDRDLVVSSILDGFGTKINGPIPSGIFPISTEVTSGDISKAKEILESNGWKINDSGIYEKTDSKTKKTETLSFTISTGETPELKSTAEILKTEWAKIGVNIDIKVFETGDLNQNIIRPRKYDALLFGMIIGRDLDLYPFWHSSQRNDPGLNIALYTNISVDKILEETRTSSDKSLRLEKYAEFEKEIEDDVPAVFLYSPDYIYVVPKKIKNIDLSHITTPGERFLNINEWFIETENVWKIFVPEENQDLN